MVEGVKGVVSAVGEVVDRLTLPAREKKQLETDLMRVFVEWEQRVMEARSAVLVEEARGTWLQRSWRPMVMLVLTLLVVLGVFTESSMLSDTSRFWDLLEIGIGGYVIGRSGETITGNLLSRRQK